MDDEEYKDYEEDERRAMARRRPPHWAVTDKEREAAAELTRLSQEMGFY